MPGERVTLASHSLTPVSRIRAMIFIASQSFERGRSRRLHAAGKGCARPVAVGAVRFGRQLVTAERSDSNSRELSLERRKLGNLTRGRSQRSFTKGAGQRNERVACSSLFLVCRLAFWTPPRVRTGWCSFNSAYEPPVGRNWEEAWDLHEDACVGTSTPTAPSAATLGDGQQNVAEGGRHADERSQNHQKGAAAPRPAESPETPAPRACAARGGACAFPAGAGISTWFTRERFDEMFPNLCADGCEDACAMLTYPCLIQATLAYPSFARSGDRRADMRELAAWLGEKRMPLDFGFLDDPYSFAFRNHGTGNYRR